MRVSVCSGRPVTGAASHREKTMNKIRMVLPKGRLLASVVNLLNDAGFGIRIHDRLYLASTPDAELEIKIMKPQNIPQLLEVDSHDLGFTGFDWIIETSAAVHPLMDLQLDPVKIVAAIPETHNPADLRGRQIVAASEYQNLTLRYLKKHKLNYYFIRTYGATEVFPPDDADLVVDNVSTGRTLAEHHLKAIDNLLESTTRFIGSRKMLSCPWKKKKVEQWITLIKAVLDARERTMLEMNVPREKLDRIVRECPCMRSPTISPLSGNQGFAVKIAIRKQESYRLIPRLKALGATDILEYDIRKVIV